MRMNEPDDIEPRQPGPLAAEGRGKRKPPPWAMYFLRALERTGKARAAAADAGIDHSTAYARRRAHAEFAQAWAAALDAHKQAKARAEAEEIAAITRTPSTIASAGNGPPPPGKLGEDLVVAGGQLRRAGAGRWSKAKETVFFEELAATANARRAAAAVAMSKNAVLRRRLKDPVFAAKWEAVVKTAKASIGLYVVEAARKTFDPDELDVGEATPRVTIDQAIKISQSAAAKAERDPMPSWQDEAEAMGPDAVEAMRERLIAKLKRIKERDQREQLAAGWSYDQSYDRMIPPGYVQGPDYTPREIEADDPQE
jgi:hypothetical protein